MQGTSRKRRRVRPNSDSENEPPDVSETYSHDSRNANDMTVGSNSALSQKRLKSDAAGESKRELALRYLQLYPGNGIQSHELVLQILPEFNGMPCALPDSNEFQKLRTSDRIDFVGESMVTEIDAFFANKQRQLVFAQRFSCPLYCFEEFRHLPRDTQTFNMNSNVLLSKLLFTVSNIHEPCILNTPRSKHMQQVFLPQFSSDKFTQSFQGVDACCTGLPCTTFFHIDHDQQSSVEPLLNLTSKICVMVSGDNTHVSRKRWYAPCPDTQFTDVNSCPSVKGILSVRHKTPDTYAQKQYGRQIVDDLDAELMQRVLNFRSATEPNIESFDDCMPFKQNQVRKVAREEHMEEKDGEEQVSTQLFSVFLWSDNIIAKKNGEPVQIRVHMLMVKPNVPCANFPLAMMQGLENVTGLRDNLKEVLQHMQKMIYNQTSYQDYFNTQENPNFVSLTLPENVPLAVHIFAHKEGMTDVHFNGQRMDISNANEMRIYNDYQQLCYKTTNAEFQQACKLTSTTARHKNVDNPRLVRSTQNISMHYRSVSLSFIEQEIERHLIEREQYLTNLHGEEKATRLMCAERVRYEEWFNHELLKDQKKAYFRVGGMLVNSGVMIKIDCTSFRRAVTSSSVEHTSFGMPGLFSELWRLYFKCLNVKQRNVLEDFWNDNELVPYLEALNHHEMKKTPATLLLLPKLMPVSYDMHLHNNQEKERMVLQFVGLNGMHEIHADQDRTIHDATTFLWCTWKDVMREGILQAVEDMEFCRLEYWQSASKSLLELEQDKVLLKKVSVEVLGLLNSLYTDQIDLACVGNIDNTACALQGVLRQGFNKVHNLAWTNLNLFEVMNTVSQATFGYGDVYGTILWVSDTGQSVKVMYSENDGFHSCDFDMKTTGAGVDACIKLWKRSNTAVFERFLNNTKVGEWFVKHARKDESMVHNSTFSMAQLNGSGALVNANGEWDNYNIILKDAGTLAFSTEMLKMFSSNHGKILELESMLPHSGSSFTSKEQCRYETTHHLKKMKISEVIKFPKAVMCSNNFQRSLPPSFKTGGRCRVILSGTPDQLFGVLLVTKKEKQSPFKEVLAGSAMEVENFLHEMSEPRLQEMATGFTEISGISVEFGKSKPTFLVLQHLMRYVLPYMHSTLTLQESQFGLHTSFNINKVQSSIDFLSRGLRRNYITPNDFQRTFAGPYLKATLQPWHMQHSMHRCLVQRAQDDDFSLREVVLDTLIAYQTCQVSLQAMFGALWIWLTSCVLDVGVMILLCFAMYVCEWSSFCSIQTILKVMRQQTLTDEEWFEYSQLANFIFNAVAKMDSESEARFKNRRYELRSATLLVQDVVQHQESLNFKDLQSIFCNSEENTMRNDMRKNSMDMSTYLRHPTRFVGSTPEWFPCNALNKNNRHSTPLLSTSISEQIAQCFAEMQTQEAQNMREKFGKTVDVIEFWKKVHEGTRLPCQQKQSGTFASVKYKSSHLSGCFYDMGIETLGSADGLLHDFVLLCGMQPSNSLSDFVEKFLQPFVFAKDVSDPMRFFSIPKSGKWAQPLFDSNRKRQTPILRLLPMSTAQYTQSFAHNMEIVLGIDVLGFILFQSMVCREWSNTEDYKKVVVHNRNMGSISTVLITLIMYMSVPKTMLPIDSLILPGATHSDSAHMAIDIVPELLQCERMWVNAGNVASVAVARDILLDLQLHKSSVFVHVAKLDMAIRRCKLQELEGAEKHAVKLLSLWPVESTYHMQNHMQLFELAMRSKILSWKEGEVLNFANCFMHLDLTSKCVSHAAFSLTQIFAFEREIPCICLKHKALFVLKLDREKANFYVESVKQSVEIDIDLLSDKMLLPVANLCKCEDCISEKNPAKWDYINKFLEKGMAFEADKTRFCVRGLCKKAHADAESMPTLPFPSVSWPVLVCLEISGMKVCEAEPDVMSFNDCVLESFKTAFCCVGDLVSCYKDAYVNLEDFSCPELQKLLTNKVPANCLIKALPVRLNIDATQMVLLHHDGLTDPENAFWYLDAHFCMELEEGQTKRYMFFVDLQHLLGSLDNVTLLQDFQNDDDLVVFPYESMPLAAVSVYRINDCQYFDKKDLQMPCASSKAVEQHNKKSKLQAELLQNDHYRVTCSNSESVLLEIQSKALKNEIQACQEVIELLVKAGDKLEKHAQRFLLKPETASIRVQLPSYESDNNSRLLGIVQRQEEGYFLVNGAYKVSFWHEDWNTTYFDFLSMSTCMLPEGHELLLHLTPNTYASLRQSSKTLALQLQDHSIHDYLTSMSLDQEDFTSDSLGIFLLAYYVLGPATHCTDEDEAHLPHVRALVCCGEKMLMFCVPMLDNLQQPLVFTHDTMRYWYESSLYGPRGSFEDVRIVKSLVRAEFASSQIPHPNSATLRYMPGDVPYLVPMS